MYNNQNSNNTMKKLRIGVSLTSLLLSLSLHAQSEYVNPLIGTQGMGHTFPGACVPFSMIQLSPDTDTLSHNINGAYVPEVYAYCAGYQYDDPTIVGFSHTHLNGTGHSDLGDILIMPATGELKLNPGRASHPDEGYRSRFSHQTEKAEPGYYEVVLDDAVDDACRLFGCFYQIVQGIAGIFHPVGEECKRRVFCQDAGGSLFQRTYPVLVGTKPSPGQTSCFYRTAVHRQDGK